VRVWLHRLAEAASALKAEERANTSLKSERESLSARLKQTFEELQAARLDASVKGSSLATLQSQYDKLQVRLQKTEREEKTVAKSLTETSSEINTLKSQITVLQGQLASAEYAHRVAHDALLAMTTERDDLKEAVSTLRKRIRDVETSQTRTQAELTDSNALIDKLKQSVTSLEEQAAKDHTTISSLRKSSANAERRAEEAEAAMARLKAETDDAVLQLTTVGHCWIQSPEFLACASCVRKEYFPVSWQTKDGLSRLSMLEAELAAEKAKNEELLAAKNAAVRKAESLQHDLSKKRVFSSVCPALLLRLDRVCFDVAGLCVCSPGRGHDTRTI
jgi:chromosome segregation ATPase